MKNLQPKFIILLMLSAFISTSAFAQEKLLKSVSLKFTIEGKIETVAVKLESFAPLKISADKVISTKAMLESGKSAEGIAWATDNPRRPKTRSGYIFNNATQCWIWGTFVTDPKGQTWFYPGTASEQAYHNICAPDGQFYCKP